MELIVNNSKSAIAGAVNENIPRPGGKMRGHGNIIVPPVPRNSHAGNGIVLIQNTTNATIPQFGILGISGILTSFKPDKNLPLFISGTPRFTGVTPTVASHSNKFVVAIAPIAKNSFGPAKLYGEVQVKLSSTDAATNPTTLGVKDGDSTKMTTGGSRAQVLWVASAADANGDWWAVVYLGGGGLPPGGTARQVLQRDENGNAVWDWTQTP